MQNARFQFSARTKTFARVENEAVCVTNYSHLMQKATGKKKKKLSQSFYNKHELKSLQSGAVTHSGSRAEHHAATLFISPVQNKKA